MNTDSMVDVIIPVGPGHEEVFNRAAQSVAIASEYADVNVRLLKIQDPHGECGRSAARNYGVGQATSEWLFFLDADDLMHPDALRQLIEPATTENDAIFGLTTELVGGNILTRYQVPSISSYADLIRYEPYLTVKMGHFVRREVALKVPFDEDMDCGEDWDYYLRLWKGFNCVKINSPLFIKVRGQHSTGPRSATGADWNTAVDALLEDARNSERLIANA